MRISVSAHAPAYRISGSDGILRLERRDPAGHRLLRAGIALVLAVFAAMPPAAVYAFSDGNPWAPVVAVPLFILFPWYPTLGAFAWFLGEALGSWRWIEVDGSRGRVRARRDGYFLWGVRTVTIPADAIRDLTVSRRHEGDGEAPPAARIRIEHASGRWLFSSGETTTHLSFTHEEHDGRVPLIRFAFRLARVLGWSGYRLTRDDHLETTVSLEETAGAGARPVPAAGEDVGEAAGSREQEPGDPGPEAPVPPADLPPFEPVMLDSSWAVRVWDPGREVVLEKEGMTIGRALWTSVLGTLLVNLPTGAAGVAIYVGAADVGRFWELVVLAVFLFVTFTLNAYVWTEGRSSRRVSLDWGAGLCRLTKDGRRVEFPLTSVEEIEVRGYRSDRGGGEGSRSHWCEVLVRTPEGLGLVARTGSGPGPDATYRAAGRMAEDLAEALSVDWRWRGWRRRSGYERARRLARRLWARYGPGGPG